MRRHQDACACFYQPSPASRGRRRIVRRRWTRPNTGAGGGARSETAASSRTGTSAARRGRGAGTPRPAGSACGRTCGRQGPARCAARHRPARHRGSRRRRHRPLRSDPYRRHGVRHDQLGGGRTGASRLGVRRPGTGGTRHGRPPTVRRGVRGDAAKRRGAGLGARGPLAPGGRRGAAPSPVWRGRRAPSRRRAGRVRAARQRAARHGACRHRAGSANPTAVSCAGCSSTRSTPTAVPRRGATCPRRVCSWRKKPDAIVQVPVFAEGKRHVRNQVALPGVRRRQPLL